MTGSASTATPLAETQPRSTRPWEWLLAVLLIVVFVLQVQAASPQKSAAFDEQYHLAAGYSYLRTGDFRMATTHPPLAGMLAALPLLTRDDINLPLDHPTWEAGNRFDFSDVFLWYANEDPQDLLIPARAAITVLGVILLMVLLLWTRRLFGMSAALLVLTLAAFDPNLIANARVVTTDLALTTFLLLATWRLWAWLRAGRWVDLLMLGLFGGLAMATKYNALLFWPIALAIALLYPVTGSSWWRVTVRRLGALLLAGLVGVFVVWGIYRFDFGALQAIAFPLPVPAPFYWDRLWLTLTDILDETAVKPDFLLGQVSSGGWWYYFPVAIGVKTPLPSLLFFLAGLAALVRWGGWRRHAALWVPPLAFLVLGLTGILTIGYRHLLSAVPFALLLAGNSLRWGRGVRRSWIPATVIGVLVAWLVFGSLRVWPHQEAYFNELAGDWRNWSNILVDSNLDWGQDLPALRTTMDELGIDRVNLGYFGKAAPEKYGVRYSPLPGYLRFMVGRETDAYNPYTPPPGWYAISATSLRLGTLQPETVDMYAFFRPLTPDARAGYSIYLYHVEPDADEVVIRPVLIGQPVWQIPPDQLGVEPGTRVQSKWTQITDINDLSTRRRICSPRRRHV